MRIMLKRHLWPHLKNDVYNDLERIRTGFFETIVANTDRLSKRFHLSCVLEHILQNWKACPKLPTSSWQKWCDSLCPFSKWIFFCFLLFTVQQWWLPLFLLENHVNHCVVQYMTALAETIHDIHLSIGIVFTRRYLNRSLLWHPLDDL